MALKARPHPSLLLVLAPLAVTAFAAYVVGWRWQELAAGMSGKTAYWFLRAAPVPALLFGPLAGLLSVWTLQPIGLPGRCRFSGKCRNSCRDVF